jgi:hypothetical protein
MVETGCLQATGPTAFNLYSSPTASGEGFLSGCKRSAILWYAFLISDGVASFANPRTSYRSFPSKPSSLFLLRSSSPAPSCSCSSSSSDSSSYCSSSPSSSPCSSSLSSITRLPLLRPISLAFLCFCVIQKREGWGVPSSGESRKRAEMRTKKKVGVSVIVVRLTLGRAARACVMLEQPTRWCVWCARVYMWPLCRGILKYFESSFFFFFCQSDLSRHFPTLQAPTHSHTSVFGHHRRAR